MEGEQVRDSWELGKVGRPGSKLLQKLERELDNKS